MQGRVQAIVAAESTNEVGEQTTSFAAQVYRVDEDDGTLLYEERFPHETE